MGRLLQKFVVLDLANLQGQFCGRVLTDLGMEVIKVEPPEGNSVRRLPPFRQGVPHPEGSLRFAYLNAGKKSITLNLETVDGKRLFRELIVRSDVVLESFAPGHLTAMDLGYATLSSWNPKIIMASITGFGQTGPHSGYQCAELIGEAMGGLLYIAGQPDGVPCKPPETQAFYMASLYAAIGVLTALFYRHRTGRGQYIDVSIQESLANMEHLIALYANHGRIQKRLGSQSPNAAPGNIYPTKDGYVYLFVSGGHDWKALLGLIRQCPAEFEKEQWESVTFRQERAHIIDPVISAWTSKFLRAELVNLLQSHELSCLPVNDLQDVLEDEQLKDRGYFTPLDDGHSFSKWPGSPFCLNQERVKVRSVPRLGQHNVEIYCGSLGLSSEDMIVYRAANVI